MSHSAIWILGQKRGIIIGIAPLQVSEAPVERIRWAYAYFVIKGEY